MSWLDLLSEDNLRWNEIAAHLPFASSMAHCPQDSVHHAEGDVWTHTRMVVEALHSDAEYQSLPTERRRTLTLAALLHDIGKPLTTTHEWDEKEQRERVRQLGHARIGARMAWRALLQEGADLALRQSVYWPIVWHQRPFHLWSQDNMLRHAILYSAVANWRDLLILARADNRGRIAPNRQQTEDAIALLALWLAENGILDRPWPFADAASQREFVEKPERSPHYATQSPKGSHVVVMCGLPGSGKDSYIRANFEGRAVVSLDALREEMNVAPTDDQGAVIQAAYEAARGHLRIKRDFIWNATNVTRQTREKIISLARGYDAYVAVHVIERPLNVVLRQNKSRERRVPHEVIENLAAKFEPPSVLEAHEAAWVE
ncbi:AAA family ATPase [Methylocystis heyeri]|uniref:AAA family ATPase n=1 Tax=Methylocystis heyeri TaxID=391905 RepID=A0A6B8KBR9_9HYPH|nr:AAA family ATPase [Methylocystis heyeri]QGM44495.1 AAA family ATPase [Methylocystis heyeri]